MKKKFPIENNRNKISIFLKSLKITLKKTWRKLKKFAGKHPIFFQFLQINVLYFYAIITLIFSVRNSAGFIPETLSNVFPFINQLISFSFLKFIATPEKTFLIYFLVMELVLNNDEINMLVKYNVLLVFLLEMLENLAISTWDLLVNRELQNLEGDIIFSQLGASNFFTFFFFFIFSLYLCCYFYAIAFKIISFPEPFRKITDSVAFWLNMKRIDPNKKKTGKRKDKE